MPEHKPLRSDIAWSTPDRIVVKGMDLCGDILGKVSLGDMAFLELMDRLPSPQEATVFNALAVLLVEHGMTPSAIVARMTLSGAPEAMQAAVAAGLCGLGSVFVGSMETAARMLQEALPDPGAAEPFEIAAANGFSGKYVALMMAIARHAEQGLGKPLPVNATGAIAAVASEIGLPWNIVRGIGVMARAIGLVGHIREELRLPMARGILTRVEEEASSHLRG
jgi:citrate synthase